MKAPRNTGELPGLSGPEGSSSGPGAEGRNGRTTICHATHSETNPYVTITVAGPALEAHRRHQDREDIIPAPEGGCPGGTPPVQDGGPGMDAGETMPPADMGPDAPTGDGGPIITLDMGTEGSCEPCRQTCEECEQKCEACDASDAACLDKCKNCRITCDVCSCDCNGCEFLCERCRNSCAACAEGDESCWVSCQSCRDECMECRFPSGVCEPQSCADQKKNCGTVTDGCGQQLHCGDCLEGERCGTEAHPNVCVSICEISGFCTPRG